MTKDSQIETLEPADNELVTTDDAVIGRAFRWSIGAVAVLAVVVIAVVMWVKRPQPVAPPTQPSVSIPRAMASDAAPPVVRFTDVTEESGIDFVQENGATGDKLLPETMGSGCGFFDFDDDGDQDLVLVNSTNWPDQPPGDGPPPTMGLYENDGRGRFANVTSGSGLDISIYGTGVAVGDYDGDGRDDVYVTAVGPNHLFKNQGAGRFSDVTAQAKVAGLDHEWSTSTGFVDYDNDGDLDLFVCNYVRWSRDIDLAVNYTLVGIGRAYGPPMNFEGTQPYLFRNDGDGTFTEVAEQAGLWVLNQATGRPVAKSLAVAMMDVDGDGWIDLLVANDTVRNFFYHNQGAQGAPSFAEEGEYMGVAYDRNGQATGAMGIDVGYHRGDDAIGFFIGNFANEMTSAYVSQGSSHLFADEAIAEGIGAPSRLMLSFGLFLFDYDLDGRLDLLQSNGHLEDEINIVQPSQHYEQPAQLFWNNGPAATHTFSSVDSHGAGDLAEPIVGRGAAYADVDLDGDLDVLFTQVRRRPLLLRNDQNLGHHWLRVTLVGKNGNRDAIGAVIEVDVNGRTLKRQVMPTRSYLSQVELPVTLGLGDADTVDQLRVRWPDGRTSQRARLSADRSITITHPDVDGAT